MDFYAIPYKDQFILYRPRRRLAFVGNRALVTYVQGRLAGAQMMLAPSIEAFLETVGFLEPDVEVEQPAIGAEIHPTQAVLLMTNRCNLRCIYCYANAGAGSETSQMSWPIAQAVIDAALANAQRPGADPPGLTFHGGGEPTAHWALLEQASLYAKERDARTRLSMSSNGVWSDRQRAFICRNFDSVSLSMDGIAIVQDHQRPRVNGTGTFPAVMESLAALDESGIAYGVRMTAMPETACRIPEGVRLICERTNAQAIQVEPTFTSSRGHYANLDQTFAESFSVHFLDAWRIGRRAGRHVYYSGARPWSLTTAFCVAPLTAMVATADGRLVTCFEVFSEQSPQVENFTVGRIDQGKVHYHHEALHRFMSRQQERREECADCFCYWHCAGDCATRRPIPATIAGGRCHATRRITMGILLDYMTDAGGTWRGMPAQRPNLPEGCTPQAHVAGET